MEVTYFCNSCGNKFIEYEEYILEIPDVACSICHSMMIIINEE